MKFDILKLQKWDNSYNIYGQYIGIKPITTKHYEGPPSDTEKQSRTADDKDVECHLKSVLIFRQIIKA